MKYWAIGLAAASALASGAGFAADKPAPARASELQAVVACRAITDSAARLACYDDAAAKLDEAEASGQVVVVDREQIQKVRKESFGLQLPSLSIFSAPPKKGQAPIDSNVDQLEAGVTKVWRLPDGKWAIELDTGALWRQVDNSEFANDPHPGSKVVIKTGVLGAFFMKVDGQPAIRVRREH